MTYLGVVGVAATSIAAGIVTLASLDWALALKSKFSQGGQWGHAVNSAKQLAECLNSNGKITMLEVDIGLHVATNACVTVHASTVEGKALEECFEYKDWLKAVLDHNLKNCNNIVVIKLDFKNVHCIRPCLQHTAQAFSKFGSKIPLPQVWINADIVAGPGCVIPNVNAAEFFEATKDPETKTLILPSAAFSLGWSTRFSLFSLLYTPRHVELMKSVCDECIPSNVPITFAVRASLVKFSWKTLQGLVDPRWRPCEPSLTLWTGDEGVPYKDLEWIERQSHKEPKCTIYYDVDKGSKLSWFNPFRWVWK